MSKKTNPEKSPLNVSFSSLGELLDWLPDDERKLVDFLREIVLENVPGCKEKLSFSVPFFSRHASICFIWPGSVTWGGVPQRGVRFGFMYGNLLADESNYLDKGKRKQVYWRDFYHIREVDVPLLRSYLWEAVEIDEEKARLRKSRKKAVK
jgi:hypothetical protein